MDHAFWSRCLKPQTKTANKISRLKHSAWLAGPPAIYADPKKAPKEAADHSDLLWCFIYWTESRRIAEVNGPCLRIDIVKKQTCLMLTCHCQRGRETMAVSVANEGRPAAHPWRYVIWDMRYERCTHMLMGWMLFTKQNTSWCNIRLGDFERWEKAGKWGIPEKWRCLRRFVLSNCARHDQAIKCWHHQFNKGSFERCLDLRLCSIGARSIQIHM